MTPPLTRVTILLFQGCDAMDVVGPYEVLVTASRLAPHPPFEVQTATVDGAPVTAYGGLGLMPSGRLEGRNPDVLIVPGIIDLDAGLADEPLIAAVAELGAAAEITASVCTGAFLLHAAGLLADRPATTHFLDVGLLAARRGPQAVTTDDVRWIDDGDIVTSGGISSGIAMALHLVERLAGEPLAQETADRLDYVWTEGRG